TFAVPPELLLQVPADQEAEQVTVEDPAGDGSLSGLEVSVPVERGETWLAPMAVARDAAGGSPLVVSQLFRSDASEIVSLADNSGRLDVPLDRPTQDQPWILRYTAEDSAGNQATPKALVVNVQCTDGERSCEGEDGPFCSVEGVCIEAAGSGVSISASEPSLSLNGDERIEVNLGHMYAFCPPVGSGKNPCDRC
ncbi:hypothetical protein DUNSADRAFT_17745, partial [Dunaliella salina]